MHMKKKRRKLNLVCVFEQRVMINF